MRFEERLGWDRLGPERPEPERPEPRDAMGDRVPPATDGEPTVWSHGPQTPAERAAARRRLDRLADDW